MWDEYLSIVIRLSLAMAAGAFIGLERTYHGRPAGFRTHVLVATASSLLMLLTSFHLRLVPADQLDAIRIDPTRMAQGIMTGIGFLGAGVIVKEGLTVRGLTTAGSIWITAAIGIMIGGGLYFAALVAEVIALGALAVFRWLEAKLPSLEFGMLVVSQKRESALTEPELTEIISSHDIDCIGTSYHLHGGVLKFEIELRTRHGENFRKLAETLQGMGQIDFSINLSGG